MTLTLNSDRSIVFADSRGGVTGAVIDEVDPNISASSESVRTPAVALSNGSTSNQASASPEDEGDGALGATESSSNIHQKSSRGSNKKGKVW